MLTRHKTFENLFFLETRFFRTVNLDFLQNFEKFYSLLLVYW